MWLRQLGDNAMERTVMEAYPHDPTILWGPIYFAGFAFTWIAILFVLTGNMLRFNPSLLEGLFRSIWFVVLGFFFAVIWPITLPVLIALGVRKLIKPSPIVFSPTSAPLQSPHRWRAP